MWNVLSDHVVLEKRSLMGGYMRLLLIVETLTPPDKHVGTRI